MNERCEPWRQLKAEVARLIRAGKVENVRAMARAGLPPFDRIDWAIAVVEAKS
jgi:hypothetical protein